MTATTATSPSAFRPTIHYVPVRRARPRGLDRVIMRASLTALLWARRHADRVAVSREEQILRYHAIREVERREHESTLLVSRVR